MGISAYFAFILGSLYARERHVTSRKYQDRRFSRKGVRHSVARFAMNVDTAFGVLNLMLINFPGCASRAQKNSSVSIVSPVPKQVSVRYGIIITRDDNRATRAQLFASSPQTPFATSAWSLLEAVAGGLYMF